MTTTYSVREQQTNIDPAHKSEKVRIFGNYEDAAEFVATNYNKNGYGRLYVSED